MYIDIPFEHLQPIGETLLKKGFEAESKYFLREHYGRHDSKVKIKIEGSVTVEFLEALEEIAIESSLRGLLTQTRQSLKLMNDPSTETIVNLKTFETGLINYLSLNAIHGWLFHYDLTESYTPYVVSNISYTPADPKSGSEQYVTVCMEANSPRSESRSRRGAESSITFRTGDVKGLTIPQALAAKRYFKESDELVASYRESMKTYLNFQPMFGKQFVGKGMVKKTQGWDSERIHLDGKKRIKMVNDDPITGDTSRFTTHTEFWFWEKKNVDEKLFTEIPYHPYIRMFDLNNHTHYWVLADRLSPYKYDSTVGDKLVLPDEQRDLIDILVEDMDVIVDDIVEGKSGGTTILCLGEPGVGKTLTAEVYSEIVEKPLYRVHSGQLGTDPDKIEERLEKILTRSENWGSICLIDEADVYIRRRDNSMNHNAIVAAFLRKLEYFNGLLFLTTNRSDDVDDAIKSRAMAIVKYEKPKPNELKRIWETLSQQFDMDLKEDVIDQLVEHYPKVVGRDVKELLKLARRYHNRKVRPLDLETFRHCAIFRGIEHR